MLKHMMLFTGLLAAVSCTVLSQMTREQCREQKEIIGSVKIMKAQLRAIAADYQPIRRDRMTGMPFGFNRPWTAGEDAYMCYVEVYNIDKAMCPGLVNAEVGAAKVLVNGSMWGICTENSRIRWLFVKFPAYVQEEYRLDIRKAAQ